MSTPLSQLTNHFKDMRHENLPHTATVTKDDNGRYFGVVKHGTASSTTLPDAYASEEDALKAAQIAVNMLDEQRAHAEEKALKAE